MEGLLSAELSAARQRESKESEGFERKSCLIEISDSGLTDSSRFMLKAKETEKMNSSEI